MATNWQPLPSVSFALQSRQTFWPLVLMDSFISRSPSFTLTPPQAIFMKTELFHSDEIASNWATFNCTCLYRSYICSVKSNAQQIWFRTVNLKDFFKTIFLLKCPNRHTHTTPWFTEAPVREVSSLAQLQYVYEQRATLCMFALSFHHRYLLLFWHNMTYNIILLATEEGFYMRCVC